MSPEAEQIAVPLPDAATLAKLAAQPRFTNLTADEAARKALELWSTCHALLSDQSAGSMADRIRRIRSNLQQPEKWPASLDDFYRFVVKAKDETDAQPRF